MEHFLVVLVQDLSELAHDSVISMVRNWIFLHSKQFLLQDAQLIFDILNITPKCRLDVNVLAASHLGKSFLNCLPDLLREF